MSDPMPPVFSEDDFDDPALAARLTLGFRQLYNSVVTRPTIQDTGDLFVTSDASGAATLTIKNQLPQNPVSVKVTMVRDDNHPDTPIAYASVWRMTSTGIRITFSGLGATTKYRMGVEYR